MIFLFDLCHRWGNQSSWKMSHVSTDFAWKSIAEPVMRSYTEATDGSYIETKDSALVWHHYDADPDFGSWQAIELLDHLESVLANEPVVVKKGQHIVEVMLQVYFSYLFISLPVIVFFFLTGTCYCSQKLILANKKFNITGNYQRVSCTGCSVYTNQ